MSGAIFRHTLDAHTGSIDHTRRTNKMKKTLFALPLAALILAAACKKQETATTEQLATGQVAGTAAEAAPATIASPAPAPRSSVATAENDRLLVMKDWLKNIPAADRVEFLGGLVFLDGEVASIYTAPLKRTASKGSMDKILAGFDSPAGAPKTASPKKRKSFSPLITLSELLKDIPADVKTEFLEKMVLKNGAIVSMYTGGLKKVVPGPKVVKILNSLEPAKSELQKTFPKTLCGDGECYEAICSGEAGHRYCIDQKDYKCTTKCYSLE